MVVTDDGNSFAFGWNKHGQLGTGSTKNGKFNFGGSEKIDLLMLLLFRWKGTIH